MRLLITGSSGQIGSYVVEHARDAGHETLGVDLEPGPHTDRVGDVREASTCQSLLEDCQAVIHLAAHVSVPGSIEDPLEDARHNVLGTLQLLEAANKTPPERFVNVSSAAVLGTPQYVPLDEEHPTQPTSPYGASKLAAERYALLYRNLHDLPLTNVRPFNVYSPRQDTEDPYSGVMAAFANRVRQGEPPIVHGDGTQSRDFVHATDIARWLTQLATGTVDAPEDGILHLGTGTETTIQDLAETFLEAAGLEKDPQHGDPRPGDIPRSIADTTRMRALGLDATVDIRTGVQDLLQAPSQAL